MNMIVGGIVLFVGLVIGFAIAWMLSRGRTQLQIDVAIAQEKAVASRVPSLEGEVEKYSRRASELESQLREATASNASKGQQVSFLSEKIQGIESDIDALSALHEATTKSLQEVNERKATLEEQATRIPSLEQSTKATEEKLRKTESDLRDMSSTEAQQRQLATSLLESRERLQNQKLALDEQFAEVSLRLQDATRQRATLEEQAARIHPLEQMLAKAEAKYEVTSTELTRLKESSGRQNSKLIAELEAEQTAHALMRSRLEAEIKQRMEAEAILSKISGEFTELRTQTEADRTHAEEKLKLLTDAKEALGQQFRTLANDILEEKSKRFTEQNQTNLGQLLEPLKTRLSEFQGKVEEVYVQEGKDRTALAEQVKQLMALNQALSTDAQNLATALKGSSKTRGNWGELVLERVLEASGLRKGDEYIVQDSQMRDDGSRVYPDVVINLPENRKLVVDSKVSLVGYEAFMSAESEEARATALKQHMDSVRGHIKSLSDKHYHTLYDKSLDFVLAFIPIEPAFMLAISSDKDLFMEAWQRNVLLVSPSTLLFVVRTVAHLWRQEAQSRNAQEIAKRGGELYDKLVGFVTDIENVGARIKQAQIAYDGAHNKLASGRGNVIRKAHELRDLGVKPTKSLPSVLVDKSGINDGEIFAPGVLANATVDQRDGPDEIAVLNDLHADPASASDDV